MLRFCRVVLLLLCGALLASCAATTKPWTAQDAIKAIRDAGLAIESINTDYNSLKTELADAMPESLSHSIELKDSAILTVVGSDRSKATIRLWAYPSVEQRKAAYKDFVMAELAKLPVTPDPSSDMIDIDELVEQMQGLDMQSSDFIVDGKTASMMNFALDNLQVTGTGTLPEAELQAYEAAIRSLQ